eukprot:2484722-Amphidinium_carterae.1
MVRRACFMPYSSRTQRKTAQMNAVLAFALQLLGGPNAAILGSVGIADLQASYASIFRVPPCISVPPGLNLHQVAQSCFQVLPGVLQCSYGSFAMWISSVYGGSIVAAASFM